METPDPKLYASHTLCAMVVIPVAFLVAYPVVYVLMPPSFAILADLVQDLALVLVGDVLVLPALGLGLYWRARRRAREAPSRLREQNDTRDVF